VVQRFTETIELNGDPFQEDKIIYVAQLFQLFQTAIKQLVVKYHQLQPSLLADSQHLYPSPTCIDTNLSGPLTFIGRYSPEPTSARDFSRTFFKAKLADKDVLVKFCRKYSTLAHNTVNALGLAPELHHCAPLLGGGVMVIVDFLPHPWQALYYAIYGQTEVPDCIQQDLRTALAGLHEKNIVHGDLRRGNVMTRKDGDKWLVRIIDFDGAGVDGMDRYPVMLNDTGVIKWAKGVAPYALMYKQHDLDMLQML